MRRTGVAGIAVLCVAVAGLGAARLAWSGQPATQAAGAGELRVVVVTGGHSFEQGPFLKLFQGQEGLSFVHAPQKDHSELFEDVAGWDYDVIVLYNMTQEISQKRRANFLKLLERGVGVVALHHAFGAFQDWPEYEAVIGGRYYTRQTEVNGEVRLRSRYKHDVTFQVRVADPGHPVTAGVEDFGITDETYSGYVVSPAVRVLLTTDEPTSEKAIAWANRYAKARVFFMQLGHDGKAYSNPAFARLVRQGVRWAAGREPESQPAK